MPKLGEIAVILTGLTLRGRPAPAPGGSLRLLQLGDLDTSGSISFNHLVAAEPDMFSERYLAREGDLVFRPRGAGIAVAVMPEHQRDVLVVAPLILIRPDRTRVDPGYLAWVLRSPGAQQYFAVCARGTSVIGVGKKDLEALQIDLPALPIQKKIAAVVALQQVEDDLVNRLQKARRQLNDALLQGVVTKQVPNSHTKGQSK